MKILHLADLHLGKVVNGYSMLEDQKFALNEIIKLVEENEIEAVIIAGDIYQTKQPSNEAVLIFDYFLTELSNLDIKVLVISGNHDSSEKLSFASELLAKNNIFISKTYDGNIEKVVLNDDYGNINFYLFPYIKPQHVRKYYKDENIISYSDAIRTVIDNIEINKDERNIIISHQFILNAQTSESEEIYAGEDEAVADFYYDKFDYVALGHIHKKQTFLDGKIRYPGALLKYSASEAGYKKSMTILDMKEKGNIEVLEKNIKYLRDMRKIRGKFNEIIEKSKEDLNKYDYIHIEITDDLDIPNGLDKLRKIYPNIMTYRNLNTKQSNENFDKIIENIEEKSVIQLFDEFYKERYGSEVSKEEKKIVKEIIDSIWEEK